MKILFTGKGGNVGSWKIRGEQIGGLIGTVKPNASLDDFKAHDLIVYVKRLNPKALHNLKKCGRPWIWDLVDFYPQPAAGAWLPDKAIQFVQQAINKASPNGVIWPCKRMRDDCRRVGIVAYHHSADGALNPIRPHIKTVGYEGAPQYLGKYETILKTECLRRGWNFVINPSAHRDVDIITAFRDGEHNGYVQRHWKSNVKLTNAHGTGTPFLGQPESAYLELASEKELFADSAQDIAHALDVLTDYETRLDIRNAFLQHAIPVERVASQIANYCHKVLLETL